MLTKRLDLLHIPTNPADFGVKSLDGAANEGPSNGVLGCTVLTHLALANLGLLKLNRSGLKMAEVPNDHGDRNGATRSRRLRRREAAEGAQIVERRTKLSRIDFRDAPLTLPILPTPLS